MALRLAVNYLNTSHRFVSTAQVTVGGVTPPQSGGAGPKLDDTPPQNEASDSRPGQRRWDLKDAVGTTLELRVLIPNPLGSGFGNPLLDLRQPLEMVALPTGAISLAPTSWGNCPNRFDPRLSGQFVAARTGRRFEINVDLTFLDITDYYQARTHQLDDYNNMPQTNPPLQSGAASTLRPPDPAPHYGARLRILEFTGGKPVSWAVLIPPAVQANSSQIGAVLFFRPALPANYTNTDDLEITEMIRYLGDPTPEDTPFFAQPKPKKPGDKSWIPYPQCGWEKQVSGANKCALFVHPFPHSADFGNIIASKFPEMLASLCKILWADGTIAASVCADLRLARIAVSGFSYGGSAMYTCLQARPEKIDEMYLFDPNGTGSNKGAIEAWFRRGGKKLSMFGGGFQHGTMLAIAQELGSSDAVVKPSWRGGWGAIGSLYPIAVRTPIGLFNAPTDTTLGPLSTITNMFVDGTDGNGGLKMEAHLPSGTVGPQVVPDCVAEEAAAVALSLVNGITLGAKIKVQWTSTVTSAAQFNQNLNAISTLSQLIRHQWPVVGGDDGTGDTNRGRNFLGYLNQALSRSGFP
jgi:hypothetical protein